METWIVHHTNTTIHRCAADAAVLPLHLDTIDLRAAEIFTHISVRKQRYLERIYSSYACCEECEATLFKLEKHKGAA